MSFSGLAKFLIGFAIAIGLMVGAGVAAALYFVTKLTTLPPKPVFANDTTAVKAQAQVNKPKSQPKPAPSQPPVATPALTAASAPTATNVASTTAPEPNPAPTPSESPSPQPLEAGAYKARVTWSRGLSVRSNPTLESDRIGGIAYQQNIVVLGESDDKRWLKIRAEDGGTEGWVKAGNLERVDSE